MSDHKLPPWIPQDVSDALREASAPGWQGRVEIHYNDGQPHEISATKRRKVKRPGPASAPRCPDCERPMEARDYGNMYVCACGTKRTRAQLQVAV
jgi:hypothetical protein